MNPTTRIWAIAGGAATVAVLAGGWFIGVQPQLAAASTTAGSTTAVVAQNQATEIKIGTLSRLAAKTDTMNAQNAVLLKSVPTILKPNTFIRRINEVAALDGVTVGSVQLSDASPYTAPAAVSDGTALALGKTDVSITPANFTAVPATVSVTGTADAVLQFEHDIQNDERVFAVNSFQTTRSDDGSIAATFGGYIFTLKR